MIKKQDQKGIIYICLRSFADLGDVHIRQVIFRSMLITFLILTTLVVTIGMTVFNIGFVTIANIDATGGIFADIFSIILGFVTFGGMIILGFVLYIPTMTFISGCFADRVNLFVENKYYPSLEGQLPTLNFRRQIILSVTLLMKMFLVNLVTIPLYLISGVAAIIPFYLINGYLVGEEYFFGQVARYGDQTGAQRQELKRAMKYSPTFYGIIIVFLSTLPIINLVTPIFAVLVTAHAVIQTKHKFYPRLGDEF